jgi:hypothetical protein
MFRQHFVPQAGSTQVLDWADYNAMQLINKNALQEAERLFGRRTIDN